MVGSVWIFFLTTSQTQGHFKAKLNNPVESRPGYDRLTVHHTTTASCRIRRHKGRGTRDLSGKVEEENCNMFLLIFYFVSRCSLHRG